MAESVFGGQPLAATKEKTPGPLTDEQLQATVREATRKADDFVTNSIAPFRQIADKYYRGKTDLTYVKGRSKVVVSKVRDAVEGVLPSLARIFMSTDKIVEFYSDDEEDQGICTEQTLYCNSVFRKNGGYIALMSAATDALKAKVGIIEATYEKKEVVFSRQIPVSQAPSSGVVAAPDDVGSQPGRPATVAKDTEAPPASSDLQDLDIDTDSDPFDDSEQEASPAVEQDDEVRIETTKSYRYVWNFDAVPPEQFIIDSEATSIPTARIHGRVRELALSEIMALGYTWDQVSQIGGGVSDTDTHQGEKDQRRGYSIENKEESSNTDPSSRRILFGILYVRVDADGDGIAELRRVVTGGPNYTILSNEPVNFSPYAAFKAKIQPHQFHPISLAEDLIQDQDAQTSLLRAIVDNAHQVNNPRTEVNESVVNLDDVKNGEIGAIIRTTQVGQINELTTQFVGGQTLPVLQFLNDVSEQRSGVSRLSQGTSADALQSTTPVAANQAVTASNDRIELMARNLAETGVADLFVIILKTAIQNVKEMVTVKTKKGFVRVNPSWWHDQVSVRAAVGLGTNQTEQQKSVLTSILPIQQKFIETLGLFNPLAGWQQARETIRELAKLSGIHDISPFFPEITPEAVASVQQQQQKSAQMALQAQGQETQAYVQVESAKIEAKSRETIQKLTAEQQAQIADLNQKHAAEIAKLQTKLTDLSANIGLERQRVLLEDDRVRDKNDQDFIVNAAKVGVAADAADAKVEANRGSETRTQ